MPRRRQLTKPVILDVPTPAPPKPEPLTYTDEDGTIWTVVYLIGSKGTIGHETPNAHDATHRGFRSEWYRRSYRFRPGDDRSLDVWAVRNQFDASRPTKTMVEAVHEQMNISPRQRRADRVQEIFANRREGDQRI